jgi:hypothetical protein
MEISVAIDSEQTKSLRDIVENMEIPVAIDNEQAKSLRDIENSLIEDKLDRILLDYDSYLEFISLGYNSLKIIGDGWKTTSNKDGVVVEHFININGYSQYIVSGSAGDKGEIGYNHLNILFKKEPKRWYSLDLFQSLDRELFYSRSYYEKIVLDTERKAFAEFEYYIGYGASENARKEYKFNSENFIENITEYSTAGYWNTSEQIKKLDNGIMVYFRNNDETRNYYNIQEDKLLDCFLSVFVEKIFLMINFGYITGRNQLDVYKTDYELLRDNKEHTPLIIDILCNMTKKELAIIRNCLYANHNYNFKNEEWSYFFRKYYNQNYQGRLTEQETLRYFTDNEKWLLDIIIETENNK